MAKIYLDPGHGGNDPGAVGHGLLEKDLTLAISLKVRDILVDEYENAQVRMSRTTDKAVSLNQRTDDANAWGADYLCSIHINAGGGEGFESFTYNRPYSGKAYTNKLRSTIHDEILEATGFNNRGQKEANFHMVRESAMPASLTENGFIDNSRDAADLKNDSFLYKLARGHAVGIAKALDLVKKKPKPKQPSEDTLFKVQIGAFANKDNAEQLAERAEAAGFKTYIEVEEQ